VHSVSYLDHVFGFPVTGVDLIAVDDAAYRTLVERHDVLEGKNIETSASARGTSVAAVPFGDARWKTGGFLRQRRLGRRQRDAVTFERAPAGAESHLGHGPGLVREYVLDLAEFFVQRRGPGFGRGPGLFVVHFFVPVYEKALHETHYLDAAGHNKTTSISV